MRKPQRGQGQQTHAAYACASILKTQDLFCLITRRSVVQAGMAQEGHRRKVGSGSSLFQRSPSSFMRYSSMPYSTLPIKPALLSSSSNMPRISHDVVVFPQLPARLVQSGRLTRSLPRTQVVIVYWAVSKAQSKPVNTHSACCYDELWLVSASTKPVDYL